MNRKVSLFFLIFMLTALLYFPNNAAACVCIDSNLSTIQNYYNHDIVFAGKFLESYPYSNQQGFSSASRLKFQVYKVWKGDINNPLEFDNNYSSCSYQFIRGEEYLVYGSKTGTGQISTGLCSGNKVLSTAGDDIRILDSKYKPALIIWSYRTVAFSLLGISILAVLGYVIGKRFNKDEKISN